MFANITKETEKQIETMPIELIVLMRIVALIILFLNGTVLLCLCVKKQKMPRIYTLQMVFLCLTDSMAGTALLAMSFVDYDWFTNNVTGCCFLIGFFVSSQSAALYNVTAICINRFIIMLRVDKLQQHLTRTRVIAFSTVTFFLSCVFCSLPFLVWKPHKKNIYYNGCSMETVFRENFSSSMKMTFGIFLLPLLLTNFLYGNLFYILRRKQRRTYPEINVLPEEGTSSNIPLQKKRIIRENIVRGASSGRNLDPIDGSSNFKQVKQLNIMLTDVSNKTTLAKVGDKDNVGAAPIEGQILVKRSNSNSVPSESGLNNERRTHQTKAFNLLGLVLLSLNACTWPGITILLVDSFNESWSLSRGIKVPLFCTISFNSIVNPILYTVRVKEFRKVLIEMVLNCSCSR